MTTTPERKRSTRETTAAECYERYKASFLHTTGTGTGAGSVLPDWEHLDPAVKQRWEDAVWPLADATIELEATREDRRAADERLRRFQADEERAVSRLHALRHAVSAARAALPDMMAFAPIHGRFPELVADLQKALDAAQVA